MLNEPSSRGTSAIKVRDNHAREVQLQVDDVSIKDIGVDADVDSQGVHKLLKGSLAGGGSTENVHLPLISNDNFRRSRNSDIGNSKSQFNVNIPQSQ